VTAADPASALHVLSLRPGARFEESAEGGLALRWEGRSAALGAPPVGIREAILRIGRSGDGLERLLDHVITVDGWAALALFYAHLDKLARWRVLLRSVLDAGAPIASLLPISRGFRYPDRPLPPDRRYRLSRFAHLRRSGDGLIFESPLARSRLLVRDSRVLSLVHVLTQPHAMAELADCIDGLPRPVAQALLALLYNGEFLSEVDAAGRSCEDIDPDLCSWEFHDLLFHAGSRQGRHDNPAGATFRFRGKFLPPPAVKPPMAGEWIELPVSDTERLRRTEMPFEAVLTARRSIRRYGRRPISRAQLGEFLHRVGRIEARTPMTLADFSDADSSEPSSFDVTQRRYPSAGSLHELELYLVVARADDLAPGLYHYDPAAHHLEPLPASPDDLAALLAEASYATTIARDDLQVLILIAARFQRVSWKYSTMAYAAILKNVGVIFQTMYLVATAMGLSPCAIGSGDSDRLSRLAGTSVHAEASVGEFLLGTRPDEAASEAST
jgi:SagB-type dehydrogenase family enzyme